MKTKKVNLRTLNAEGEGVTRNDSFLVNPLKIVVDHSSNPRFDYGDEDFKELKASIKEAGLLNPISIYVNQADKTIHLAHGFRRMKAIQELLEEGVNIENVKVVEVPFNEETILIQHFILNTGKPLSDLELGDTLLKLSVLMGEENVSEISRRTGINYQKVLRLIDFAKNASTKIKKAVKDKNLSITNAIAVVKASPSTQAQNEVLEENQDKIEKGAKIKISDIKILKKNTASPFAKLRSFIEVVSSSKNTDLDFEFALKLEKLLDDVESGEYEDKELIGRNFNNFQTA